MTGGPMPERKTMFDLIVAFIRFLVAPSGPRRVRAWHRLRALCLPRINLTAKRPRKAKVVKLKETS